MGKWEGLWATCWQKCNWAFSPSLFFWAQIINNQLLSKILIPTSLIKKERKKGGERWAVVAKLVAKNYVVERMISWPSARTAVNSMTHTAGNYQVISSESVIVEGSLPNSCGNQESFYR